MIFPYQFLTECDRFYSFRREFVSLKIVIDLLIFSMPIIIGQIGQMLIGISDVWIAGRHSVDYLASVGLAMGVMAPVFICGLGFNFGLSPLISKLRGEGENVDGLFFSSLFYSVVVALLFVLFTILLIPLIPLFGFEARLVPLISEYIFYFSFSFFGAYLYQGIREFLQGKELVIAANIISIVMVVMNLFFCYSLVFGQWGFPPMGLKGLALGSIIARSLGAIMILIYAKNYLKVLKIKWTFLKDLLLFSLPIALTVLIEVLAFSAATILVGRIGVTEAAAHNIVLNLASITFMVPLAISIAISVKIAYCFGAGEYDGIISYSKAGLFLSVVFMSMTGLLFNFFPQIFGEIFSTDSEVVKVVVKLLFAVSLFQVFDGAQVTLGGILRGIGRPLSQTYTTLFAYWVIGIPLGYYLANFVGLLAFGIWMGLFISLFVAASILLFLVIRFLKKIHPRAI